MEKIELKELGEGQWIEVKNPKSLPWGKQKQLAKMVKEDDVSTGLDATEALVIALVKKGYLLDDDDKPIDFPLTEESVAKVPSFVVEIVSRMFADSKKDGKKEKQELKN